MREVGVSMALNIHAHGDGVPWISTVIWRMCGGVYSELDELMKIIKWDYYHQFTK